MQAHPRVGMLDAGRRLAAAGLGFALAAFAWADESSPAQVAGTVVARHPGGLNLLLSQSELRDWVRSYEAETGQNLTSPIDDDEVIVRAPGMLAPMRDVSQDAWGGIAAPFWAILHPKDSWRILLPIPPKGSQEDERPVPDPR